MPRKNVKRLHREPATQRASMCQLTLILFSNSDNAYHRFEVTTEMTVEEFLELALARLSEGDGAERVAALRRYYQPVLEVENGEEGRELAPHLSLADTGLANESICRIAARPLKERLMFCSYG